MAIFARNSKLINKQRFSENILSESFGGEIQSKGIAVHAYIEIFHPLRTLVIEMVVVKTEETLHNYLRRHFEKISEGKARQFAEQGNGPKKVVVTVPRSSDGISHRS